MIIIIVGRKMPSLTFIQLDLKRNHIKNTKLETSDAADVCCFPFYVWNKFDHAFLVPKHILNTWISCLSHQPLLHFYSIIASFSAKKRFFNQKNFKSYFRFKHNFIYLLQRNNAFIYNSSSRTEAPRAQKERLRISFRAACTIIE